jgi:hypothetical protein
MIKKQGGRPLGAKNKLSEAMRESLAEVLQLEINGLKERFEALLDHQRIELLIKLIPFVVPKLADEQNQEPTTQMKHFTVEILDGNGEKI